MGSLVLRFSRRYFAPTFMEPRLIWINLLFRGDLGPTVYAGRVVHPDVAEAIADGEIKSPKEHFIDSGYFEGRLPCPLKVDEAWYLERYPDIAEGIERGEMDRLWKMIFYLESGVAS